MANKSGFYLISFHFISFVGHEQALLEPSGPFTANHCSALQPSCMASQPLKEADRSVLESCREGMLGREAVINGQHRHPSSQ